LASRNGIATCALVTEQQLELQDLMSYSNAIALICSFQDILAPAFIFGTVIDLGIESERL
jgi:hypothetical protein